MPTKSLGTGTEIVINYQTEFTAKEDQEHCPLYDMLVELHERCVRHLEAPLQIEIFCENNVSLNYLEVLYNNEIKITWN